MTGPLSARTNSQLQVAGHVAVRGAAGVTPGQLREHFADRTAVLAGVCAAAPGIVPEPPVDRALRKVDSIEALRAWAELCVEQLQRNDFRGGCVLIVLAGQLATIPADRADASTVLVRWLDDLAHGLRVMCERGELRPEADPDTLASSLLSMLLGGILLTKTRRDIAPLRSAIAAMMGSVRSLATAERPG
jgi:TetR/AcrR family transcriptional repressor of nem operon